MDRSIYLVNPREAYPGYYNFEVLAAWGAAEALNFADLTLPTVAALVPSGWRVSVCDERIDPVDLDTDAAVVGLTGKVSQRPRMAELARRFRDRGKLVVIGGPYASLNPDDVRPHADILVIGELEEIAVDLFADIAAGRWRPEYRGGKPDLKLSPVPRWDLARHGVAMTAQVQTSRGCPFECEFCDVIQFLGRKQRWKEPAQVLRELDALYAYGYRSVFLADDNFTVVRRRAKELLEALAAWNRARPAGGRVTFSTQVSLDVARDDELLALCREAGVDIVFIGIETPNEESLAETHKRQNLRVDIVEQVRKVVRHGVAVTAGLIVGFDHDGPDIFERQLRFAQRLPVPMVNCGLLVAPHSTPLYERIKSEGRLRGEERLGAGSPLSTNIEPKSMSHRELIAGMRWLLNRVYAPAAFERRVMNFVDCFPDPHLRRRRFSPTPTIRRLLTAMAERGPETAQMIRRVWMTMNDRPELAGFLRYQLIAYCQTRYVLEQQRIWDPALAAMPEPPLGLVA